MGFYSSMILLIPAIIFAGWAQLKVRSTYKKFAQVGTRSRMTGAEVAQRILRDENIEIADNPEDYPPGSACGLEAIPGQLTDHYDPRARALRLSESIYGGQSVAALGIAAHEVGHAIQHARLYSPLMIRNVVYPVCSFGSSTAWPLVIIGIIFGFPPLLYLGIFLFTFAVFFSIITLPVEFNASSRALRALSNGGYLAEDELAGARKVLNAAALTYVAAAAVAIMNLVRLLVIARD